MPYLLTANPPGASPSSWVKMDDTESLRSANNGNNNAPIGNNDFATRSLRPRAAHGDVAKFSNYANAGLLANGGAGTTSRHLHQSFGSLYPNTMTNGSNAFNLQHHNPAPLSNYSLHANLGNVSFSPDLRANRYLTRSLANLTPNLCYWYCVLVLGQSLDGARLKQFSNDFLSNLANYLKQLMFLRIRQGASHGL